MLVKKDKYIYNTSITIIEDNTNIYNIYIYINNYIDKLKDEIKKLAKELDFKKGGPNDVKAIDYSKLSSGSNSGVKDINQIYREINEIVDSINELRYKLRELTKSKKQIEETLYYVAKIRKNDLELKVFIAHYVEKKRLIDIADELYRLDYFGDKQYYSYQHIRRINANLKSKLDLNE